MNRLGIAALITTSLCAARAFAGVSLASEATPSLCSNGGSESHAIVPREGERMTVAAFVEPPVWGDTFRSCAGPHGPMRLPKRQKGSRGCGCQANDPAGFAVIAIVLAFGLSARRSSR